MNPAPNAVPDAARAPDASQDRRQYTPGFSDGLGDRLLLFDTSTASSLELLRFKKEFSEAPGFEAALRKRIDELGHLRHPSVATVRTVERLGTGDGLALVSTHTAGRRLSEMVQAARGAPFALDLIQQIGPALSALQQQGSGPQGSGITHGVLTAERIVVTREGRLMLVEHVLGSALESLRLPASRLRSELGIAVPTGADLVRFDSRTDVIQLGFIALSLVLGRRLAASDYPGNIQSLLDEFARADAAASARMRPWLERALQIGKRPFESAQDAHEAFVELAGQIQPHAADSQRGVLAFHPPNASAAAAAERKPGAASKVEEKKKKKESPGLTGRTTLLIKWGAAALALVVVIEALIIAGLFSSKPTFVVATPPPRTDVPGPLTAAPIAPAVAAPIVLGAEANIQKTAIESSQPASPSTAEAAPVVPPVGGRFGGIKVSAAIELKVFESDKLVGSTAGPIAVVDGSHVLDLVNEELGFRLRQTVNVKPGQMTSLNISVPNGRISINAMPWAEVFIDGNPAGQTPLANLSLPIGKHEIVFRHPQLGSQTQTAVVKVEGLTRVSANFQQ